MPEGRRIVVGAITARSPAEGGIHRFTLSMLRELLALDPGMLGLVSAPELRAELGDRARVVTPPALARGNLTGNALRLAWNQTVLPGILRRERASLYYATAPEGMLRPPCAQIITLHDLIPLLYPESAPRLSHYYRRILPAIVRRSRALVVMSEATRGDVIRLLGVPDEKVHVVHQGYRADIFQAEPRDADPEIRRRHVRGRYLLAMADERPYKNLPRLLDAFARLGHADLTLALVGRVGGPRSELRKRTSALGLGERVRFLGFVPDDELAALYRGAEAFVFPSLYEGFGIPPLEAMGCGCPVVVSDRASLPEVCGDAAVYIDPEDVASIVGGLEKALDPGLRDAARLRAIARAAQFSDRRAAEQVMGVLEQYDAAALAPR